MRLGYVIVRAVAQTLFRIGWGITVQGLENVPRNGRIILASNHRSNIDPPLIGSVLHREVHYFAKEELFRNPIVAWFIRYLNAFPVHRGQLDREALKGCLQRLKRGDGLVFFPEGTRAPNDGFLRAKIGLGWIAALSGAPVIPVYIHGSSNPPKLFHWRPVLHLLFGEPILVSDPAFENLRSHDLYQAISDTALERIRDLSLNTPFHLIAERGRIYERDIIDKDYLR